MGQQATLVVIYEFFSRQPAHALDESAFDLADIEGRIDGAPDVVEDIDTPDVHLAGEDVDRDLGAGRAVGEIEERPAFALVAVPVQLRRLVEAAADRCT